MPRDSTRPAPNKSTSRPSLRRRDHFDCRQCGKTTRRTGVAQLFCSPKCKKRFWRAKSATAKIFAFPTHTTGAGTTEEKLSSKNKELQGAKTPSSVPFQVVGGGYRWPAAKLDGETLAKIIRTELGNYELHHPPVDGKTKEVHLIDAPRA